MNEDKAEKPKRTDKPMPDFGLANLGCGTTTPQSEPDWENPSLKPLFVGEGYPVECLFIGNPSSQTRLKTARYFYAKGQHDFCASPTALAAAGLVTVSEIVREGYKICQDMLAARDARIKELTDLLKESKTVLDNYWFSSDGEDEVNNDDVMAICDKIAAMLTPEAKTEERG